MRVDRSQVTGRHYFFAGRYGSAHLMMSVAFECSRQCRASSFTTDCPGPCTRLMSFRGAAGLASSFMAGAGAAAGFSAGAWLYAAADDSVAMITASRMRFIRSLLSTIPYQSTIYDQDFGYF